jgi:hypothetical protein
MAADRTAPSVDREHPPQQQLRAGEVRGIATRFRLVRQRWSLRCGRRRSWNNLPPPCRAACEHAVGLHEVRTRRRDQGCKPLDELERGERDAWSFAAPLFEELVFRGTLWGLLERALPPPVVLLITSVIFAAYHVDPIHVILAFPVGLLIGWVRMTSGSIYPAILLHFVNNTLAIVLLLTLRDDTSIPRYLALVAASITAIAAVFGRYRPVAAEEV